MVVLDAKVLIAVTASAAVIVAGCGILFLLDDGDIPDTVLSITGEGIFENGSYDSVIVSSAVGDGSVTLRNVTILKSLVIRGGGDHSVTLENCVNKGTTTVEKEGGQDIRIYLIGTKLPGVNAFSPVILESDADSDFGTVLLKGSNAIVTGDSTRIGCIDMEDNSALDVKSGTVDDVRIAENSKVFLDKSPAALIIRATVGDNVSIDASDDTDLESVDIGMSDKAITEMVKIRGKSAEAHKHAPGQTKRVGLFSL